MLVIFPCEIFNSLPVLIGIGLSLLDIHIKIGDGLPRPIQPFLYPFKLRVIDADKRDIVKNCSDTLCQLYDTLENIGCRNIETLLGIIPRDSPLMERKRYPINHITYGLS